MRHRQQAYVGGRKQELVVLVADSDLPVFPPFYLDPIALSSNDRPPRAPTTQRPATPRTAAGKSRACLPGSSMFKPKRRPKLPTRHSLQSPEKTFGVVADLPRAIEIGKFDSQRLLEREQPVHP